MSSRVQAFVAALTGGAPLVGNHAADAQLRRLVVHIVLADGVVKAEEVELLSALWPELDRTVLRQVVENERLQEVNFGRLRETLSEEEAGQVLGLAERVARADQRIQGQELAFLLTIRRQLGGRGGLVGPRSP
jgi:uncharacterized tellurite resistance protein B-like protein